MIGRSGGGDGPTVTTVRRGTKQQLRQKLEALAVRPRKAVGVTGPCQAFQVRVDKV